ncbi:MAG TPA: hypothetical protein VGL69_14945 [Solirubrobacteraceae bacterium]|jgi:hypothetical protein
MSGEGAGPVHPSLAATASKRVQAILEAAEASAEEIRREAQDEAEATRARAHADAGRASESIDAAVRRLEELHADLGALITSLRTGEGASAPSAPEATAAPTAPAKPKAPAKTKPEAPARAEAPAPAQAEAPAKAETAAGEQDAAGVRLIALNMALDGTPREQAARFLAENFSLEDPERLLDEVYASAGG